MDVLPSEITQFSAVALNPLAVKCCARVSPAEAPLLPGSPCTPVGRASRRGAWPDAFIQQVQARPVACPPAQGRRRLRLWGHLCRGAALSVPPASAASPLSSRTQVGLCRPCPPPGAQPGCSAGGENITEPWQLRIRMSRHSWERGERPELSLNPGVPEKASP